MKSIIALIVCFIGINLNAQENHYDETFSDISIMLSQNEYYDFKNAVFLTENAYQDGILDKESFDNNVKFYSSVCKNLVSIGNWKIPLKMPPLFLSNVSSHSYGN